MKNEKDIFKRFGNLEYNEFSEIQEYLDEDDEGVYFTDPEDAHCWQNLFNPMEIIEKGKKNNLMNEKIEKYMMFNIYELEDYITLSEEIKDGTLKNQIKNECVRARKELLEKYSFLDPLEDIIETWNYSENAVAIYCDRKNVWMEVRPSLYERRGDAEEYLLDQAEGGCFLAVIDYINEKTLLERLEEEEYYYQTI